MTAPRRAQITDWINAILLWLLFAFSLGWYYTITYYGREGWPMPSVEGCGGLILYYFSVLNTATEIQAIHWMIVFPLAGVVWVALLRLTAPYFGGGTVELHWAAFRFALATLPLSLPGPYLAWVAAHARGGWSLRVMFEVALRRGGVQPWAWLSPLYLGLALLALAWHIYVYAHVFELHGKQAWRHFLITGILFVLVVAGLGSILGVPLRYYVEGQLYLPAF
jgi:hypothetical protein